MADPHGVIRQYMRAVVEGDNMPISLGRGTREKLAAVWGELGYNSLAEIGVKEAPAIGVKVSEALVSATMIVAPVAEETKTPSSAHGFGLWS